MIINFLLWGLTVSVIGCVVYGQEDNGYLRGLGSETKKTKNNLSEAKLIKDMQSQTGINLNLQDLFHVTNKNIPEMVDIEEDEEDRFITKRNGELRANIFSPNGQNNWVEDLNSAPVKSLTGALIRKRRCGGGGGDDDDDGDANRSRRSKRIKKVRKKVKKNKKIQNTNPGSTVKTIKVIQNGQVVSQSVQYTGEPTTIHHQIPSVQPTVHVQHPAVQHQQVTTTHQVHTAPGVIVQQPTVQQPTIQHIQPPVVHVQQPVIQ